jgi:hypothetical protein
MGVKMVKWDDCTWSYQLGWIGVTTGTNGGPMDGDGWQRNMVTFWGWGYLGVAPCTIRGLA